MIFLLSTLLSLLPVSIGSSSLASITGHPSDWNIEPLLSSDEYSLLESKINKIISFIHPFPVSSEFSELDTNQSAIINDLPIGIQCKQFFAHQHDKTKQANWTYLMKDATGKLMAGMMNGNFEFMGDFDECIHLRVGTEVDPWADPNESYQAFRGRYCTLGIASHSAKLNEKSLTGFRIEKVARLGICLLSACSKRDIEVIVERHFRDDKTEVNVLACDGFDERQAKTTPKAVRFILLSIFALLVIGTLLDMITQGHLLGYSPWTDSLLAFSVSRNLRNIILEDVTPRKSRFINVFKGISMILVFHGHSHMIIRFVSLDAISKHYDMLTKPLYQMFITAGFLSVDLFLFISAFISVKIALPKFRLLFEDSKQSYLSIVNNILTLIGYRYLRLMPSLIFLMVIHVWSENLMLGPLWMEYSEKYLAPCRSSWLPNVLLINNLLPWNPESPNCAFHSWHLGLDMQLFIFSLIFFIILGSNHPKIAISLNIVLLFLGIIGKGILTGYYGYPPMVLSGNRAREDLYFSQVYTKPWFRADSYIIGLLFGYFCTTGYQLRLTQRSKKSINLVVVSLIAYILIAPASYHIVESYSTFGITLYSACHRALWALCLSWIFYWGFTNQYSYLNWIADWRIWEVLSNISYQFFLFHPILFFVYFGCTSLPLGGRMFLMLMAEPGGILFTMLISLAMTLVLEWPISNIIKILRNRSFYKNEPVKLD